MKKGLVVIYDPHALMQFLQFYCMEELDVEWDVLCLPKEDGEEEMHKYCELSGVFNKVFRGNIEYKSIKVTEKCTLFFKMLVYFVFGKRKLFCQKEINKYVDDIMQYDVLVGNTESGLITGMLASFAKEKRVIYFEDGIADYWSRRKKWKTTFKWNTLHNLEGVIMARMGYCCKGYCYFEPTKYCEKYVSNKELLSYTNYKSIHELVLDSLGKKKFMQIAERTWPELETLNVKKNSAILFTDPLYEYFCYESDILRFAQNCFIKIAEEHNNIYIKKHPRDNFDYATKLGYSITEIDQDIPAELLLPYFSNGECYFFAFSSTIMGMKTYGIMPTVFWDNSQLKRPNHAERCEKEKLRHFLNIFSGEEARIIDVF